MSEITTRMAGEMAEPRTKSTMSADILIVDDEADIRELVAGILDDEGHRMPDRRDIRGSARRRSRLAVRSSCSSISGSRAAGWMGSQILDIVKEQHPDLPVVMISGHGNIETAVSAIKRGAYDFIEKPFKADRLVLVAERALEASRLKREVKELRTKSQQASRDRRPVARPSNQLRQTIERVAATNAPRDDLRAVRARGKELAARTHPWRSPRARTGPSWRSTPPPSRPRTWRASCSASRDADGKGRKVGALEEAHGGTLYLDEVADMPRETQGKILRVLVDQNFQRVGGAMRVHVDVRVISSTGARPRARDRGRALPRGPASPAERGADPGSEPGRAARGHSRTHRLFHGSDLGVHGPAQASDRRRMRWRCCSRMTGRATSGSCATISSAC